MFDLYGCHSISQFLIFSQNKNQGITQITITKLKEEYLRKLKKTMVHQEYDNFVKSKISFEEILGQFNKKKSKDDLQHEIFVIDLKVERRNIKSDNNSLKQ